MHHRPSDARSRIVQTALTLFAARGYHNTGIADILQESCVKRGTLYHYFPSKRELGLAAIDEMARVLAEETAIRYLQTADHPIDRMLKIVDDLPGAVKLQSGEALTPSVVVRLGTADPEFGGRLSTRLAEFVAELEATVRSGVVEGQILESVNPRVLSRVFTVMCEGIFLMSVLGQRQAIWEDARHWLKEYLNSLRT
jgi:TetR/AcrR family transcriptional repressor of nem operon